VITTYRISEDPHGNVEGHIDTSRGDDNVEVRPTVPDDVPDSWESL